MENHSLILKTSLENSYFLTDSPLKEVCLYVSLKGIKAPKNNRRPPLNLSLVVDRSGSMSGEKLEYAKKAMQFVVQHLDSNDYLSIVQYDSQIEVVSPSASVNNKAELNRKIATIEARNTTNLSGGMLEGYAQVKSTQKEGFVNRNLLLSDGLANEGITDTEKLQQIAQKKFREEGIGLSTFGIGADFNEILMTQLAEYGGANYYFIEAPDQIPQIFAQELAGLLAVVVQNTKLEIAFDEKFLKVKKVHGFLAEVKGNAIKVNLNDIFAEEEKAILVAFEILKNPTQTLPFTIKLSYEDVAITMESVQKVENLSLIPTQDSEIYKKHVQEDVLHQIALFNSNDIFEQIVNLMDKREFDKAKEKLVNLKIYLENHFKLLPPTQELTKQYENIANYEQKLEAMKNMDDMDYRVSQKLARMANYTSRKKK